MGLAVRMSRRPARLQRLFRVPLPAPPPVLCVFQRVADEDTRERTHVVPC